jgi:uncharacterized protein YdbL (DUF1318 family)
MISTFKYCLLPAVVLFFAGCTIKTPEVTFTSERTALEKQILGSYRTIEEESWMVTSARSAAGEAEMISVPNRPEIAVGRKAALEAFVNRKFNADDIEDFKMDGVVGEGLEGLLVLMPSQRYSEDDTYRALVDRILLQENDDRRAIMERIAEMNSIVNPVDRKAIARVFAQMNRDASPPGTWIQTDDGKWKKK